MRLFHSQKVFLAVLLAGLVLSPVLQAQFIPVPEEDASCTSIMVGKKASTDGSVMTAHSCDGNYRTWPNIVPRQSWPEGATRKIIWASYTPKHLTIHVIPLRKERSRKWQRLSPT